MYKSIKELDIYISDGNYSSKYPRSEEFVDEGVPFIRGNNMIDGEIVEEDMYYITEEKHSVLIKGHVQTGDVLITTRGNIGQIAIIPERHDDSNINAQIVLLRVNKDELYNRYLLWALQSHKAKEQYLALQTGTALKQLPVGKLEQVKIKYVDLQSQFQVAEMFYTEEIPFEHVRINSGMVILRMKKEFLDEVYFIEQFKMQLADIKEKIASGSAQLQLPISTMNKIDLCLRY